MPAPFVPKAPKRARIPVSQEDRAAARSGMDGNKLNSALEPIPAEPVALVAIEPTPAPSKPVTPTVTELVIPVVEPTPTTESTPESIPAPSSRPRGRKPAVVTVAVAEPAAVRSVKIKENVWSEIRLVVAQLPNEEGSPRNIQTYVEAAHLHYLAYLRKQGKLPPK